MTDERRIADIERFARELLARGTAFPANEVFWLLGECRRLKDENSAAAIEAKIDGYVRDAERWRWTCKNSKERMPAELLDAVDSAIAKEKGFTNEPDAPARLPQPPS